MLESIRRYWIAALVLLMIGLHASIVGLIRYQASLAKIDASCEVELGRFLAFQTGRASPISMRLHAIVPINHRMKSRQLIELNQAQIRQSLEEHLRQIDGRVLTDPYLADLKSQLLEIMVQTIGDSSIDDLLITELCEVKDTATLEFVSRGNSQAQRRMVASLRSNADQKEEHTEGGEHGDGADSHSSSDAHASPSHASSKTDSHGETKGHSTTQAKKPAAKDSHSSEKKPAKKSSH